MEGTCGNVWYAALSQAKTENDRVGLRKCIRLLLEHKAPSHDGMRCVLFPLSWAVLQDFFPQRVQRAPGSTVLSSRTSPADLAGKCKSSGSSWAADQHGRSIDFSLGEHSPDHASQLIGQCHAGHMMMYPRG